ncbi:MAG: hypothetical protein JRE71_10640 [Deltaproteobacteria bacterium]|nr:hypothetical protein [Deltaproteobacteria bacterium]
MHWRTSLSIVVLVGALLATASVASAVDNVGATGRILALRVNTLASDDYGSFHGSLLIGDQIAGITTYWWGGSRCPATTVTEQNIAMLQRALENPRILVEPAWRTGQGGTTCLVRFTFFLRSEQGLVLP